MSATVADVASGQDAGWLVYRVGDLTLTSPLDQLAEVTRLPTLYPVPLAPPGMLGMINLRGRALAVLSMSALLGQLAVPPTPGSRLLVLYHGAQGVLVDAVHGVAEFEPAALQPADAEQRAAGWAGLFAAQGEWPDLLVPDLARLAAASVRPARSAPTQAPADTPQTMEQAADLLLAFALGDQEYAVPVAQVREVVAAPTELLVAPRMLPHMLGLMSSRGRLLPVLDARAALDAPDGTARQVLVLRVGAVEAGLLVDGATEVIDRAAGPVQPVPPLLVASGEMAEIDGILRLDDGRRLVSLLATAQLLNDPALAGLEHDMAEDDPASTQDDDALRVAVFSVGAAEFGIDVRQVLEIVAQPDRLTPAPRAPLGVIGVVNLHGVAVPVIDAQARLGFAPTPRPRARILVLSGTDGARTGLLVDAVHDVLALPDDAAELPALSDEQTRLVRRVAVTPDRMLLVVDAEGLLAGLPQWEPADA
ncbi:chemotaxis protein CheW [Chitiniphilus eburneus]|uniref:CheW-like domain-containing protein n=1 Tax=Chitiniphilus eburneus TaxID=2571148 RepID=A0A4U0QRA6_9NEIS|nr:chemotaxis protein CheW [Chitiniphilus eburneus]TJZ78754.1 hypothetical protein FAZ21_00225 [Chitiniphilus eburneus]